MHQAQDTFTGVLEDGTAFTVVKGEYRPDGHELVKRDKNGSGTLFRHVDFDEGDTSEAPAKSDPPKDDPKPAAKAAARKPPAAKP
jgi:hypothetical protein